MNKVISGEPNSEHREFAASGNHREGERTHSHPQGEPGGQTQAFDFYSRYFAPWYGVAEDPVTGTFALNPEES